MTSEHSATAWYYHGTRADLRHGDLIAPGSSDSDGATSRVLLTQALDEAIWGAELAPGEGTPRVYIVEPTGPVEKDPTRVEKKVPGPLAMSCRSARPLRVTGEVTEWRLYHGTRADLKPGDLIEPGRRPNFGSQERTTTHVYLTRTLDAAVWGAELALGEGPGRVYVVEPTGPIEDDPDLTNKRFRGNPTKSFRSMAPLRVTGEVLDWQGHSAEALQAMRNGIARLGQQGGEPVQD